LLVLFSTSRFTLSLAVMAAAVSSILPDNADLFSQRAKGVTQKGQPLWDRVLVILLVVSYVGQIVFIPLDVFRFHLVPKPDGLVSFLGLSLYVAGWWIMTLAMKVNPFSVPVVRLQNCSSNTLRTANTAMGFPPKGVLRVPAANDYHARDEHHDAIRPFPEWGGAGELFGTRLNR
jgi:hypothetical protein